MAITQKDILEVLPRFLCNKDYKLVCALKDLAVNGWGYCAFTKKMRALCHEVRAIRGNDFYKLERRFSYTKNLTLTKVNCLGCFDSGKNIAFDDSNEIIKKDNGDYVYSPCKECNVAGV
jgi:hypothetical protein